MKNFARRHGISLSYVSLFERPDGLCQDMPRHYQVRLSRRDSDRTFVTLYSTGEAVRRPTLDNVLESLAMDLSGLSQSFEEWASELGYDADSRRAYRIWEACCEQEPKLRDFMGDLADEFLAVHYGDWEVDDE